MLLSSFSVRWKMIYKMRRIHWSRNISHCWTVHPNTNKVKWALLGVTRKDIGEGQSELVFLFLALNFSWFFYTVHSTVYTVRMISITNRLCPTIFDWLYVYFRGAGTGSVNHSGYSSSEEDVVGGSVVNGSRTDSALPESDPSFSRGKYLVQPLSDLSFYLLFIVYRILFKLYLDS